MSKLILGTAQFGSEYGIKQDGKPSEAEIERIAHIAKGAGIRTIFTAPAYKCDDIVAKYFSDFEVIEKIGNTQEFKYGERFGLSVYDIHELMPMASHHSILNIPLNVFDNRFLFLTEFKKRYGLEVHARSVFLQGLLLMENPPIAREQVDEFHRACGVSRVTPVQAALGYVLGIHGIDGVVIGVNSAEQLSELVKVTPLYWDYDFHMHDERIIDPRQWKFNVIEKSEETKIFKRRGRPPKKEEQE